MQNYIKITNPIYPFIIHVFLNYTDKKIIKSKLKTKTKIHTQTLHEKVEELDLKHTYGRTFEHLGHIICILTRFNKTISCYDTLHHEIVHIVDFSAEYIGLEQPTYVREYSAYLTGFITKKIYQKIL